MNTSEDPGNNDSVYFRIRTDIVNGVFPAGSALKFSELQSRYSLGISRLREALSQLHADQLVTREPNRGYRVPETSIANFQDITKMRLRLEPDTLKQSFMSGDDDWEDKVVIAGHRLHRAAERSRQNPNNGISSDWEQRHREFHVALLDACGSPMSLHFCQLLHDHFDRYRRLVGYDTRCQNVLEGQHIELATMATSRAAEDAAELITNHIKLTEDMVVGRLRDQGH